ncbi:hypothetical protein [Marinomonas algicola]|uniref:hypothetical protein n=1 Tax=Marinomonas algicola TaxID=2773454 RepID=UPI001748C78A|nr:hypothetical protein [Marinomonas algicola]
MKYYVFNGQRLQLKQLYSLPFMSKVRVAKLIEKYAIDVESDVTDILTKENALLVLKSKRNFGYYLHGELLTLKEIAERVSISKSSVNSRIKLRGIEIETDVSELFLDVTIK